MDSQQDQVEMQLMLHKYDDVINKQNRQYQYAESHPKYYWEENGQLVHKDMLINNEYNMDLLPQSRDRQQRFYDTQHEEISSISAASISIEPHKFYVCQRSNDTELQLQIGKVLQVRACAIKTKSASKKKYNK